MAEPGPGPNTEVKRAAKRAHYDRSVIDPIIDEAILCHVGTVRNGIAITIPTLHARIGDDLILHGSPASQMLRTAKTQDISATITLVDGFVLARSALHHSMNYRSVVIVGRPEPVAPEAKAAALDALTEKLVPGRLPFLRPMSTKDLQGTSVLRLPITEASAKVRSGGPTLGLTKTWEIVLVSR